MTMRIRAALLGLGVAATGVVALSLTGADADEAAAATAAKPACWIDIYGEIERIDSSITAKRLPAQALAARATAVSARAAAPQSKRPAASFGHAKLMQRQSKALADAKFQERLADGSEVWNTEVAEGTASFVLQRSDVDGAWRVAEEHIPGTEEMCR
jgi:hypothetical protein